MVRKLIGIAVLAIYILAVILKAPDLVRWGIALGAILIVIVEYYWFSGRKFDSDEK